MVFKLISPEEPCAASGPKRSPLLTRYVLPMLMCLCGHSSCHAGCHPALPAFNNDSPAMMSARPHCNLAGGQGVVTAVRLTVKESSRAKSFAPCMPAYTALSTRCKSLNSAGRCAERGLPDRYTEETERSTSSAA